jgi:hypothetical protein
VKFFRIHSKKVPTRPSPNRPPEETTPEKVKAL